MLCLLWVGCKKPFLSKPSIIKFKNLLTSDLLAKNSYNPETISKVFFEKLLNSSKQKIIAL